MQIALLAGGDGWHVRDLQRAASAAGHIACVVDFRRVVAGLAGLTDSLAGYDAAIVRTMPPGSLEQVVFRMNLLQQAAARGVRFLNSPAALECCVDKYLASARLERAGLPVPPTVVCQDSDQAMEAFEKLGGDVIV